jgi:hypothetical protein
LARRGSQLLQTPVCFSRSTANHLQPPLHALLSVQPQPTHRASGVAVNALKSACASRSLARTVVPRLLDRK